MRGLFVLMTVVLLCVAPLGVISASAQDDEAWDNVARPTLGAPLVDLENLQETLDALAAEQQRGDVESILAQLEEQQFGYVVSFLQPFAHIPEIDNAELIAVHIRSGEFVLDNMGPSPFTVVTGGDGIINSMTITQEGIEAHYTLNEDAFCNQPLCEITAPDTGGSPRIALQLLEGDWVIAPAEELCVWCLLNAYAGAGETTGILYVYPLITDVEFTWIQAWDADPKPESEGMATPSAQSEALSGVMTWALFNPAPNCRNG